MDNWRNDKRSHLNLRLRNHWTKLNQTWQGWSLGGSLSKLCPTAPSSSQKNQNYSFPCSCSQNLSSFRFIIKQQWTIEEISIFSNSSQAGVVPFQYCVRQCRPPLKMAAVTKNRNFFSCQFLLYYKSKWTQIFNIPKWNKLAEKISQKYLEYMLNYSLPCSCS
jgi:hypothetical protein